MADNISNSLNNLHINSDNNKLTMNRLLNADDPLNDIVLSDLGDYGQAIPQKLRHLNLRPSTIFSTLENYYKLGPIPEKFATKAIEVFQDLYENDNNILFKILAGESLYDQNTFGLSSEAAISIIQFHLTCLPPRVEVKPNIPKFRQIFAISFNASIQRIFVLDSEDIEFNSKFQRFCLNNRTNKLAYINYSDHVYVAQALFNLNVNHEFGPNTINFLENSLDGFLPKSGFWQSCVGTVCKLSTILRHSDNLMTVSCTLIDLLLNWGVGFELATKLWDLITPYATTLIKYFHGYRAQADICGISESVFRAIVAVIASLLAVVGTMALPSQKLLDTVLLRTSNMGRALTGFEKMFELLKGVFDKVYGYVYEFIFGLPLPGTDLSELIAGLSDWYDEVGELSSLDKNDEIQKNFKLCRRVEKVYSAGMEYMLRMSQLKLSASAKQPFDHYWRIVIKLYEKVCSQGSRSAGPRSEPVIIHLFGASSVGKSGLTYLLGQDLLACEGLEKYVMDELYFRNVEQEFWDGYNGQAITVYDDFGQKRDSIGNPNAEFMEVIRTGNVAPWPLHMAHLEAKSRTRFTSRAVILTSNEKRFNMTSLTHAEAFHRRINLYAEVKVNPNYANELGRVDPAKVKGVLDENIYSFTMYGENGQPYQMAQPNSANNYEMQDIVIDYATFKALAQNAYLGKFKESRSKISTLLARADTIDKPLDIIDTTLDIEMLRAERLADMAEMNKLDAQIQLRTLNQVAPTPFRAQNRTEMDDAISLLRSDDKCSFIDYWESIAITVWLSSVTKHDLKKSVIDYPNLVSMAATWEQSYDDFKFSVYSWFTQNDPDKLRLKSSGTDKQWMDIEGLILKEYLKPLSQIDAQTSYMQVCKKKLLDAINSLVDMVPDDNAHKLFKAFGTTVALICFGVGLKTFFGKPKQKLVHYYTEEDVLGYYDIFNTSKPREERIDAWNDLARDERKRLNDDLDARYNIQREQWYAQDDLNAESRPEEKTTARKTFKTESRPEEKILARRAFKTESRPEDKLPRHNKVFRTEMAEDDDIAYPDELKLTDIDMTKTRSSTRRSNKKMKAEAAIDPNSQQLMNTTIKANTYLMCVDDGFGGYIGKVNIIFVTGRTAIMVKHAVGYLTDTIALRNPTNHDGILVRKSEIEIHPFTTTEGKPLDLVSLTFPRQVPGHANLIKSFVKTGDLRNFQRARANLYSVYASVHKGRVIPAERVYTLSNLAAVDCTSYVHTRGTFQEEIEIRKGYMYDAETQGGDCTGPILLSCTQIQRKIIGVHVAGSTTGSAIAQSVTGDMLDRHLLMIKNFQAQVGYDVEDLDIIVDEMPSLPEGDFMPVGIAKVACGSSSKTQLRRSKLYGRVTTPTTKPAHLYPIEVNGVMVDPMLKGLQKCGGTNPLIDTDLLNRCKKHIISNLKRYTYADKKVFSHAEAITGVEGDPWLVPMNRRSSPGYPWSLHRRGTMGKTRWLGSDEEYILDEPELLARCERRIELAKQGIRLPTLWTDTLKDERRPIAKVDEGKTRVFSAGSMDYILNVRQYFLAFNAAMMDNKIRNEIAVGINPFSTDWHILALHLLKQGSHVCAGDFSNFDGSLLSVFLWAVLDIINEWYQGSEEDTKIRTVLFYEIVNSIHIRGDNVYSWTHSQPSGNPLTTMINCLMNSLIFRYVFVKATNLTLRDWDEKISFISYGDDNVINIHPSILPIFNQIIISKECAKIGFTYTDEAKTGELVESKTLDDINFLKRSFRVDEDTAMYVAPLELCTILEMTMWVRGDIDPDTRCSENVDICYKELSIHGRTTFDIWSKTIDEIAQVYLPDPPILYEYEEYLNQALEYF